MNILSHISPMRYAVDLARGVFYVRRRDEYEAVVLASPVVNMIIVGAMFAAFLVIVLLQQPLI